MALLQVEQMNLESFLVDEPSWGSDVEKQTRLRIKLSVAAYAYEIKNDEIMSDGDFDKQCLDVDLSIKTNNKKLDEYFKNEFDPSTGSWIYKHPELNKIETIYKKYYA